MVLLVDQWVPADDRTFGEMFRLSTPEAAEPSFSESLTLLLETLTQIVNSLYF